MIHDRIARRPATPPARRSPAPRRSPGLRRSALLGPALLSASALLLTPAAPAHAFGTVNALGQHAEHERITRAALACAPGTSPAADDCFQPRSLDQLAGRSRSFGAIGAPDTDEVLNPAAHCDNADFLAVPGYPRTREQATAALRECVSHLRKRFAEGVAAAGGVLGDDGTVLPAQTGLRRDCSFTLGIPGRNKCEALEGLGRALHGAQDFYAHSNWTDRHDAARPLGLDNPPGLDRPAPSPLLNLTTDRPPHATAVPEAFTTGCFSVLIVGCSRRIGHGGLNKDTGAVDALTGATGAAGSPRGALAGNFGRAVAGAVTETRRQWADFRAALVRAHGKERGARIACALTHDEPARDCG
ncbi:CinY protein [Streptomyces sp. URMC 123]|uniref:CinY protein n=1 Tax=Streptomyces sp. URMC 123 TaxID=3423403 RepID=UPI003F1E0C1B